MKFGEVEQSSNVSDVLIDLQDEFQTRLESQAYRFKMHKSMTISGRAGEHDKLTITGPWAIAYDQSSEIVSLQGNKEDFRDKSSILIGLNMGDSVGYSYRNGSSYNIPQRLGLRYNDGIPMFYMRKSRIGDIETLRIDVLIENEKQLFLKSHEDSITI